MNDIKKDSYYLNEISVLTTVRDNYYIYSILPKYGEGTFTILNIIPGLKLAFNSFELYHEIINYNDEYQLFSEPILKINYCIKGKMLACNKRGKICLSNKGSIAYYYGVENIYTVEHFDKYYESITLFGYINKMSDVFEKIFEIKKCEFTNFCKLINKEKDFIVGNSNSKIISLLNEIKEAFKSNKYENIKIKTIELLIYELKNFEKNRKRKEVYYSKSTIDKIINIEIYIMNNLDKKITLNMLCEKFNISLDKLKRCFKQMYGTSVYAYIKKSRMDKGKELIENSDRSITEISLICGYSNHHSFTKAFKEQYKITPRETRRLNMQ